MGKKKISNKTPLHKKKRIWTIAVLFIIITVMTAYHTSWKALPEGISYQGDVHQVSDIGFYHDLTYTNKQGKTVHEREIFQEYYRLISEADEFIVADMFLFNGYTDGKREFPPISWKLVDAIIDQKKKHPDLKAVFITDQINTAYNSYQAGTIERLRANGVDVVITSLQELRDSNPLYSSLWRTFVQWFGQKGNGWIPNPLAAEAPEVTLRSYLKMLNIKANHRKLLVTEDAAMVATANPHDASGFHENVAFKLTGAIQKDILEAEKAVIDYSTEDEIAYPNLDNYDFENNKGKLTAQFLTEGKIYKAILSDLENVKADDTIWMGMYYLADRKILERIKEAAKSGTTVNIVLDPNKTAFGTKKTGLPNLPVAAELVEFGSENITIRWYDVNKEQFHTKLLFIDKAQKKDIIIGGSANYTRRNLANLNLEADVRITGSKEEKVIKEVRGYFERIWNNRDGKYTVNYEEYESELDFLLYLTYRLQKILWFTTY
ncbi:phospholipase D family protein [Thalassobacillus pellis]|uniref:phospholipase D family protein n=1 Tax=Thalassobacillus pellis TaxID=748008 RepID=UPI001960A706|nr:phospholipase D family protein [Thalassobacillus pellis]MBM7553023.1 hypothetical protein [Thalassobacillus pellis]